MADSSVDSQSSKLTRWAIAGVSALLLITVAILYRFNPIEHAFYPRCMLHVLTGLDCPGCGGLRATHQLLHGNIIAALKLNALFVALLPIGFYFATRHMVFVITGTRWPQLFKNSRWPIVAAVVVIGFGVLRNLPWRSWLGV
jgi:hypothetical protein